MKRTRLKRTSKKAVTLKKLDALLRELILRRDGYRCRKCGALGQGRGHAIQASHILPKGQFPSLRYEPRNVIALCQKHHLYWWHKNPVQAGLWILAELGQGELDWLRMVGLSRKGKRDLEAIKLYLEMEIARLRE